MNTRHLLLFTHVAKAGSMTKVAEELRISQPAISAQIKRLEDELGVPLFTPHGRGVKLTDAGQTCLEYAEGLLGLESQLVRSMNEFREGQRGRIIVAASPSIGTYILPQYLASFQQKHAGIGFELQLHGSSEEIERMVQTGQVDIGITLATPQEHFALRVTRLIVDEWVGVQSQVKEDSMQVFYAKDATPPLPQATVWNSVELDSTEVVKRFVQHGMGTGVVLRSAVRMEMIAGYLQQWDEYEPRDTSISIVTRPAEKLSVSLWLFIGHLQRASLVG